MSGDVAPYIAKVTSEHSDKPNFIAALTALLQGAADGIAIGEALPLAFDIDSAVGKQLDDVGLWVGITRQLLEPIAGVYFSFDTDGVGFDEGYWQGRFDPDSGIVILPDDAYRTLLRITILANNWDGTIPGAYAVWNAVFNTFSPGQGIAIFDNQDMSMDLVVMGTVIDSITLALLGGGYVHLKPAGVRLNVYLNTVPGGPLFGFDYENDTISGFDVGAFATLLSVS